MPVREVPSKTGNGGASHLFRRLEFPSGKTVLVNENIEDWARLQDAVEAALDEVTLPAKRDAFILLKPNLNNDLVALTGNSTDLRLLRVVIEALHSRGYNNLAIGDGPNFGTYRLGIDVFRRLGVDKLASFYNVRVVDFNRDTPLFFDFLNGKSIGLARSCLQAEFIINLAKIKTHAEAGVSLACKNLLGCCVGIQKKRVHDNLPYAIVKLNRLIRPGLHIVEGLVAMEGNGPGDGLPRELGFLFAGRDPFLLDAVVVQSVGLNLEAMPYLRIALREGLIDKADWESIKDITPSTTLLPPPPRRLVTRVLTHNRMTWLRDALRPLFYNKPVLNLLHRWRIIQDIYEAKDARIRLRLNGADERVLVRLSAYCPMGLDIKSFAFDPQEPRCIACLYCFWLSPDGIIDIIGEPGYLASHIRRYRKLIRERVGKGWRGG